MTLGFVCCTLATASCSGPEKEASARPGASFSQLREDYVRWFLKRNPVVATYLGGAALDPTLTEIDGSLRDHSARALREEDEKLASLRSTLEDVDGTALQPQERVDRQVMLSQIRFLLHQHQVRHYQQRALDTYIDAPFRGIDWQLQGMDRHGDHAYGSMEEWSRVAQRLEAIPAYLSVAADQLQAGVQENNTPDWRMLRQNGLGATQADADYFASTLPALARERIAGAQRKEVLARILEGAQAAAGAYGKLRAFVVATYFLDPNIAGPAGLKPPFRSDQFSLGEVEYDWALKNNLKVEKSAADLYQEAWPVVQATRRQMQDLARSLGQKHGWSLPADGAEAVRAVFDRLSGDYPHSDVEMVDDYRATAIRLVGYARQTGLFDVPDDYRLEVVETPPPLRASIDGAAYYPAPPFKDQGVGRFYVTPTGNDPAALKSNNQAALADLAAHEGFPGHDWHFKVMTGFRDEISPVRWLTPGAVEDSSSMWEDSMAAEGWALYSEALMAEPQAASPDGFYTPEEHLYQLQGQLYRDLRVRVDIGIHTGRLGFDEAVDLFSQVVDFLPGSCAEGSREKSATKRASCESAGRAIFRYSKWPTQAITYRLGKDAILALRAEARGRMGNRFDLKQFHLQFMKQGTIPAGYFKDEFLKAQEFGPQAGGRPLEPAAS